MYIYFLCKQIYKAMKVNVFDLVRAAKQWTSIQTKPVRRRSGSKLVTNYNALSRRLVRRRNI